MATIGLIATACAGGGHIDLTLRVNGTTQGTWPMTFEELIEPVTDEEKELYAKLTVKLRKIGKTNAQLRTDLQNGFQVTV